MDLMPMHALRQEENVEETQSTEQILEGEARLEAGSNSKRHLLEAQDLALSLETSKRR